MNIANSIKTGKLELWSKYKEAQRQKHELTYLFWECTLNCNFNCKHCGSRAGGGVFHRDELSASEIKGALKDIANRFDAKKIMLAITGGEPLLRKDLFEVMGFARKLGFSWGMVTNGYLMTPEITKKAKAAGMATVVVSVDGLQKTHDELRGVKGAYQRAIEAIKLLATENFLKNIQITTVVSKRNFAELEQMYSEFSKLPIDSWRVINIDPIGRAEDNKDLLLSDEQFKKVIEFISEKRKKSKIDVTFGCSGYLGLGYEGKTRPWLFNCVTGISTGSILHNGDIFVCPNVPRRPEFIQGNIRQESFTEVWNNKFEFFRNKERTTCSECKKCNDWEYCLGNSFHLWDFEKVEPKICYREVLEKTAK